MISIANVLRRAERFSSDNAPLILTVYGAIGVLATAFTATRATVLAVEAVNKENETRNEPMTRSEVVSMVWPFYISTAAVVGTTCTSVVLAHRIGARRTAAMATAFGLSEKAFSEYQEKVIERYGEKKELAIRDEIQQDRVTNNPVQDREVVIIGNGEQLCYDSYSGRYFQSTMEDLKQAINRLNHRIINDNYASLTDFYNYIGLERTAISDELGWNIGELFDVHFTTVMSSDQRPAIALEYRTKPFREFFRIH